MRRLTVWWKDSHCGVSAFYDAEIERQHRPVIFGTTGWLVKSDRQGILLCVDITRDGNPDYAPYKQGNFIPRSSIVEIERLEPKE